jgi:hypothetical protein
VDANDPVVLTLLIRSIVAGIGGLLSKGDEGFMMRVTQKHFATPSSPLTRETQIPRSALCLKEPRRTHELLLIDSDSVGAESI